MVVTGLFSNLAYFTLATKSSGSAQCIGAGGKEKSEGGKSVPRDASYKVGSHFSASYPFILH